MSLYQSEELRTEGIVNVRRLRKFYMREQVNEHMVFILEGEISAEDAEEYGRTRLLGQVVRISHTSEGEDALVGCGVITEAEICSAGALYYISIKGHSASYSLTAEKKRRSFQNVNWTYREVLRRLGGEHADILYCHRAEKRFSPLIQYDESDWEVLRRLAGQLHTVLIPDVRSGKARVILGHTKRKVYELNQAGDVRISVHRNQEGGVKLCRVIGHPSDMGLGDTAIMDRREWTIIEKQAEYKNEMLVMEYTLGRLEDCALPLVYNPHLRGATIPGRVLIRNQEYVKLWLEIDDEQSQEDAFWYPYLPETGNVMYSMPEEGARAAVYFPDADERNGIAVHSFFSNIRLNADRIHERKEMRTPSGKKISFSPDVLEIAGDREREANVVCLGEETGVQVESRRRIRLTAKGNINIRSGLSCSISAGNQISVRQTGGKNWIEMSGAQIISQAEKYDTTSLAHKGNQAAEERNRMSGEPLNGQLYPSFIGMIAQGDCGEINGRILGGIPTLGSVKGEISLQTQVGLRIRRKF